ncbi:hypothetical protein OE88DRAFT_1791278 [Heliocybe sulcata]|uniref:Uncharacterized protein n=1 Tax=Heliocybe sulcata TaxID=5364 RepID=A0A5C3N6A2_9AGAM|nr:hypothetical protein OE88DRAFT_1791278 [Heliocybe sulcata]
MASRYNLRTRVPPATSTPVQSAPRPRCVNTGTGASGAVAQSQNDVLPEEADSVQPNSSRPVQPSPRSYAEAVVSRSPSPINLGEGQMPPITSLNAKGRSRSVDSIVHYNNDTFHSMEADAGAISESNVGNTSNWQRVTYQRSGSPNARGRRTPPVPQSVTPRAPDNVALSTEQVQTINSARAGLTAAELAQVKQRERLVQPVINPVKHGESSRNKGKGIDPREFGGAGIPTEELDPARQAAEYELWHAHRDTTPASIVTSVNSVTIPEPTRASVPPANRIPGRDALLGKARQLREELARLETEIASTDVENSENVTARASKKRPVQSPNLSEEQRQPYDVCHRWHGVGYGTPGKLQGTYLE